MTYLKPLILIILITGSGCKNQSLVSGRLKNLTGLENCRWIIELEKPDRNGNQKLEPVNLDNFKITLADGQSVKLSYTEVNVMSTCMAGKTVELKAIRNK